MSRDRNEAKEGEAFASRWSRLKRRAKTPPAEEAGAPAAETAGPPAGDERSDEEILGELGLPDPDTLKAGDDFKRFMASTVPARIRNRALRRLWTSNPVLANLDRLVDYDDDFTDAAMVPEILSSGYKVGRGWLTDEPEAKAEGTSTNPDAEEEGAGEPADPAQELPDPAQEPAPLAGATAGEGEDPQQAQAEEVDGDSADGAGEGAGRSRAETRGSPQRRRMRFRFTNA